MFWLALLSWIQGGDSTTLCLVRQLLYRKVPACGGYTKSSNSRKGHFRPSLHREHHSRAHRYYLCACTQYTTHIHTIKRSVSLILCSLVSYQELSVAYRYKVRWQLRGEGCASKIKENRPIASERTRVVWLDNEEVDFVCYSVSALTTIQRRHKTLQELTRTALALNWRKNRTDHSCTGACGRPGDCCCSKAKTVTRYTKFCRHSNAPTNSRQTSTI